MIRWEAKRPTEVRDYTHDWTPFLGTDTIASKITTANGVTVDSDSLEPGARAVKFWVSGGAVGTATITHTIVTAGGRTESETFILPIATNDEPVSLAEAKAHLEVDHDDRDAMIQGIITAAREWVENYTGRILVRRTITEYRAGFGNFLELRHRPVVKDSAIIAYSDGTLVDEPVTGFVASAREPVRISPPASGYWPSIGRHGEVTIAYTAGYASGEVPQAMIHAMLLLIAEFYANREAGSVSADAERAVSSLLRPFRHMTL